MADILLDEQSVPASPAAGQSLWYPDSAASAMALIDDSGKKFIPGGLTNRSIANLVTVAATNTFITGSRIVFPSFGMQAAMRYRLRFSVSKGAVGTAAAVFTVVIGTNGTTADTVRTTHTTAAQTAVAEVGWYELNVILRNTGAAGVLQSSLVVTRNGGVAATGLAAVPVQEVTSAGFDTSYVANQGIGVCVNCGTGGVWTITQVQADLDFG